MNTVWILFFLAIGGQIAGIVVNVWASKRPTRREARLQEKIAILEEALKKADADLQHEKETFIQYIDESRNEAAEHGQQIAQIGSLIYGIDLWKYATPKQKEEFWAKFNAIIRTQEGGAQ